MIFGLLASTVLGIKTHMITVQRDVKTVYKDTTQSAERRESNKPPVGSWLVTHPPQVGSSEGPDRAAAHLTHNER